MPDNFLETYFDDRGEIALENMGELMKKFPRYAPRATASVLRSEGWYLRKKIRTNMDRGTMLLGWPKLNPHTGIVNRIGTKGKAFGEKGSLPLKNWRMVWKGPKGRKKRVREYKRYWLSTRENPMARLAGAVRYNYDPDQYLVSIGFIGDRSGRLRRYVHEQAEGYSTTVTPRMRKAFFALGFPLKKTTHQLRTPSRKVIEPTYRREEKKSRRRMRKKYIQNIHRYILQDAASGLRRRAA